MIYLDYNWCHPQAILCPISLLFDFLNAERSLAAGGGLYECDARSYWTENLCLVRTTARYRLRRKHHEAQRSASWETRPKGGYSQLVYIYIYI